MTLAINEKTHVQHTIISIVQQIWRDGWQHVHARHPRDYHMHMYIHVHVNVYLLLQFLFHFLCLLALDD